MGIRSFRLLRQPRHYYISTLDFDEELTVYECLDRGIPLLGNYLVLDMYQGFRRASIITEKFLQNEDRLFQPEFNIHHRLMIGIKHERNNINTQR